MSKVIENAKRAQRRLTAQTAARHEELDAQLAGPHHIPSPEGLRRPENITAAVVAKCHSDNQLRLIEDELKRLRLLQRCWKKRRAECMGVMTEEARKDQEERGP